MKPIVAHRGNTAEYPENTLESVMSALSLGVQYVEVDIQFSRDNIPFVCHDPLLIRTYGIDLDIRTTDSNTLKNVGVPTLEYMLHNISSYAVQWGYPITAFVEIKEESFVKSNLTHCIKQLNKLVAATYGWHTELKIVVISFDLDLVETYDELQASKQYSSWRRNEIGWVVRYPEVCYKQIEQSKCKYAFVDKTHLYENTKLPQLVTWVAYEISPDEIEQMLSRGVNLIETYQVRKALEVVKDYR